MATLEHPYANIDKIQPLRGNLHAHTTHSDGDRSRPEVVADYAQRGYDFLMLSDHDIFTSAQELREVALGDLVLIPGNEITANGPHMLHIAAGRRVDPSNDRQRCLDAVAQQGDGIVVACHPNWSYPRGEADFNHCSLENLRKWNGFCGLEIYNGVIGRLNGSPYATNKWDLLLSEGRKLWGFANDDSHATTGDVELGWNVVWAAERTPAGIVDALRQGRFYASTGVAITGIRVEDAHVQIETADAQRVVAIMQHGQRLKVADGPHIEVEVPADAGYVRFECWGTGEKFAWTQPFWVTSPPEPQSPS